MSRITGIEYDRSELLDIMDTICEGAIDSWAIVDSISYTLPPEVRQPESMLLKPVDGVTFQPFVLLLIDISDAIKKIVSGGVELNQQVRHTIASGDAAMINAEAADCIVQVAVFGSLVYR